MFVRAPPRSVAARSTAPVRRATLSRIRPFSRTGSAAGRRVAPRANHRNTGGAGHQIAGLRAGQPWRAEHHAVRTLAAGGVTGRGGAGEMAGAVGSAIALTIGAGARAGGVRGTAHVAGGRLAAEIATAPAFTGAGAIGAFGVAAIVVADAPGMARRSGTGEIATVSRGTLTGAVAAVAIGSARRDESGGGGRRGHDENNGQVNFRAHDRTLARGVALSHRNH